MQLWKGPVKLTGPFLFVRVPWEQNFFTDLARLIRSLLFQMNDGYPPQ